MWTNFKNSRNMDSWLRCSRQSTRRDWGEGSERPGEEDPACLEGMDEHRNKEERYNPSSFHHSKFSSVDFWPLLTSSDSIAFDHFLFPYVSFLSHIWVSFCCFLLIDFIPSEIECMNTLHIHLDFFPLLSIPIIFPREGFHFIYRLSLHWIKLLYFISESMNITIS